MRRNKVATDKEPLPGWAKNHVSSSRTVRFLAVSCFNTFYRERYSLYFSYVQKYKTIKCSVCFSDTFPCFNIFCLFLLLK